MGVFMVDRPTVDAGNHRACWGSDMRELIVRLIRCLGIWGVIAPALVDRLLSVVRREEI